MARQLGWYFARLSSMSLPEVGYRIHHQLKIRADRRRLASPTVATSHAGTAAIADDAWTQFRQGTPPFFFSATNSLPLQVAERFPDEQQATLAQATALLENRFELFGKPISLADPIQWQHDPINGKAWPNKFWADIDTRDGETIGGVKWVWELNRHHQWVTLGKAFYLTQDERFAAALCRQWASWIEANPVGWGVNWTSPLEMALRIINWSWALAYIRPSAALTPSLFADILQSVTAQANHIERYLSAYSSANNHLIGEAAGLAMAGLAFPWLPDAARWRERGLQIMEAELSPQILADGVPAEQAVHYLLFVLDFNLVVWRLAALNGASVPAIWHEKLEAACDFLIHLMDGHGEVAHIGDSDDAWVVRLDARAEVNNFRSLLATGAALFRRADFKAAAGRWDEKSQWLLGDEGFDAFQALPDAPNVVESKVFPQGGYTALRDAGRTGDNVVIFDHGPLGFLATAAHGHADALSLTLNVDGQPLLIDPGTYAYQEGGAWRTYLRGTAAHNTVLVNGTDQSEMQGTFLWGRKANANLVQWHSTPEFDRVVGEHDGYATQGVSHQRTVIFDKPDFIYVIDRLTGTSSGTSSNIATPTFEQLWHFPAGSDVQENAGVYRIAINGKNLTILQLEAVEMDVSRYHGLESPIQGWMSARYGEIVPAPVLGFGGKLQLPITIRTVLALDDMLDATSGAQAMEELRKKLRSRIDLLEQ